MAFSFDSKNSGLKKIIFSKVGIVLGTIVLLLILISTWFVCGDSFCVLSNNYNLGSKNIVCFGDCGLDSASGAFAGTFASTNNNLALAIREGKVSEIGTIIPANGYAAEIKRQCYLGGKTIDECKKISEGACLGTIQVFYASGVGLEKGKVYLKLKDTFNFNNSIEGSEPVVLMAYIYQGIASFYGLPEGSFEFAYAGEKIPAIGGVINIGTENKNCFGQEKIIIK
jgi:hypothetical protein